MWCVAVTFLQDNAALVAQFNEKALEFQFSCIVFLIDWTVGGNCAEGSGHQGTSSGHRAHAEVFQHPGAMWCRFDYADPVLN